MRRCPEKRKARCRCFEGKHVRFPAVPAAGQPFAGGGLAQLITVLRQMCTVKTDRRVGEGSRFEEILCLVNLAEKFQCLAEHTCFVIAGRGCDLCLERIEQGESDRHGVAAAAKSLSRRAANSRALRIGHDSSSRRFALLSPTVSAGAHSIVLCCSTRPVRELRNKDRTKPVICQPTWFVQQRQIAPQREFAFGPLLHVYAGERIKRPKERPSVLCQRVRVISQCGMVASQTLFTKTGVWKWQA